MTTTQENPFLEQFFSTFCPEQFERVRRGFENTRNWSPQIAQTPHRTVYEIGKAKLVYYPPAAEAAVNYLPPVLVVFSLINRPYVLDLKPGKSVIEQLVKAGFPVYLIDWGSPGPSDQFLTLDDYVNRTMRRFVQWIQRKDSVERVSMLGYCMGGTMAGIFAARYPTWIENLILMAAPFDFGSGDGLLNRWSDEKHFQAGHLVAAMGGNIPPWFLQSCFTMLKPMQNTVDKYVKYYENQDNPQFVDDFLTLEYWLNDNIPLVGPVYQQFVEDCFQHNRLIQQKMPLGNQVIDLTAIQCPVLSLVAEHDHLVPPSSSKALHDHLGPTRSGKADNTVISFPSGHIGLSVSGRAMKELWPQACQWLQSRSEQARSQ
ncbi:MAG: alpha/beta fold hydrolase [Cyanobacteria bacterium]|nr:alpha/beta fold hydrolase [Cyanobacteriota bacterium]